MGDWDKVYELTQRMKGFCLPPPAPNQTGKEYFRSVLDRMLPYALSLSSIHAIASRNVQHHQTPPDQAQVIPESKEDGEI